MSGESAVRSAQDIGGQELSYAEVKAIASGNPAVLTLAESDAELQRLSVLKKNHADEQYLARRNVRDLPQTIESLSQRLSGLSADRQTALAHADDPITIGNHPCSHGEALTQLGERLDAVPWHVSQTRRILLGLYRGLRFGLVLHPQFAPEVYLEGAGTRQDTLSRDHHGPRAVLNALERLASSYRTPCESAQQDLAIAQAQLRDYQSRLGAPFPHDEYLSRLTALRDQLKAGLSGAAPEPGAASPQVSEIAEQIKALKSDHTIEATPQRTAKLRAAAEEPVTSRIRRRTETLPASGPTIEPDATTSSPSSLLTPETASSPSPVSAPERTSKSFPIPAALMRHFTTATDCAIPFSLTN